MQFSARAPWELARGEALSLDIGPGPRELSVTEGRVWLTQSGALEDVWLQPGQSVLLASGARVVVEGYPAAKFQLLVPPAACRVQRRKASAAPASGAWAAGRGAASGLAAA
jgi:hypothetical protein